MIWSCLSYGHVLSFMCVCMHSCIYTFMHSLITCRSFMDLLDWIDCVILLILDLITHTVMHAMVCIHSHSFSHLSSFIYVCINSLVCIYIRKHIHISIPLHLHLYMPVCICVFVCVALSLQATHLPACLQKGVRAKVAAMMPRGMATRTNLPFAREPATCIPRERTWLAHLALKLTALGV